MNKDMFKWADCKQFNNEKVYLLTHEDSGILYNINIQISCIGIVVPK